MKYLGVVLNKTVDLELKLNYGDIVVIGGEDVFLLARKFNLNTMENYVVLTRLSSGATTKVIAGDLKTVGRYLVDRYGRSRIEVYPASEYELLVERIS